MSFSVRALFLILALVTFVMAGFGITHPRMNLTAFGLALLTCAFMVA